MRTAVRLRSAALLWGLVSALAVSACTTVEVETEAAPGEDPTRYETFHVLPTARSGDAADTYGAVVLEAVRVQVAETLTARGYREVPLQDAELRVTPELVGVAASRLVNSGDHDVNSYVEEPYVESTIVILAAEPGGKIVWLGRGSTKLVTTGRLVTTNVAAATSRKAREVLAEFPAR